MTHSTLFRSKKEIHFYGLDVHQETISIAVAYGTDEPKYLRTIENTAESVEAFFKPRLGSEIHVVYEAGGCGFVLYRNLTAMGIECLVAAPSKITKTVKEAKNDKLDAIKLTKLLRNHVLMGGKELHEVYVPDEFTEAIQAATRNREFHKKEEKRIKQRILGMLRKHGFRYKDTKTNWNKTHRAWLERVKFTCAINQEIYRDLLDSLHEREERVKRWDKRLDELCEQWNQSHLVMALCCLKGIQRLTALSIVAEIGNFGRFEHPKYLMAYLGLVPSEYSSGELVTRGKITKTGNKRVRWLLIEAAQAATRIPKSKRSFLASCPPGVPPEAAEHAYKASLRLNKTFYRLLNQGKNSNVAKVAVARELVGFIWGIATIIDSLSSTETPNTTKTALRKTA